MNHAVQSGGPVLEAGCGTGRTLFPVAAAGVDIVGVELSAEMTAIARQHASRLPVEVQGRVTLLQGDMVALPEAASGPFQLISLPYRTFMHLLTVEQQRAALLGFRQRLAAGGRLVFNTFDPTADLVNVLTSEPVPDDVSEWPVDMEFDGADGRRVRARYRRGYSLEQQILQQEFCYQTIDAAGTVTQQERGELLLRYLYRYEIEHLLATCGFAIVELAGDFDGAPYAGYGEQVITAAPAD